MKTIPDFDTHELAWAAGFFDGEGSFHVANNRSTNNRSYKRIRATICQVNDYVLNRFRYAVKVGVIRGPRKMDYGQPRYDYTTDKFEFVQHVVAVLWKYLSPVKKAQASKMMKNYLTHIRQCKLDNLPIAVV